MTRQSPEIIAVARALQLLNAFSFEKDAYTLTELSERLGFYKSTVHRLVRTLEKWGYLRKEGKQITLGPQVFILGEIYYHSLDLVHLSEPILEDIAKETGETAAVYVRDGLDRLCLCRVQSPQHIRDSVEPGQKLPIYTGASGKLLLAFCEDPSVLESLKSMSLAPLTPKTITDFGTLTDRLQKIRHAGFAISFGERDLSAAAIAVPIWGERQRLYGSLSISGPAARFTEEKQRNLLNVLWKHARNLSSLLGYSGKFWNTGPMIGEANFPSNSNPLRKEKHPWTS